MDLIEIKGDLMYIGITERGDAGLDLSWVNKLYDANILITKNPNDEFIEEVLKQQNKIILHITCTGYGESILEPNVPTWTRVKSQVSKLIALGFPSEQIVLRVDPIIPTQKVLNLIEEIIFSFAILGIKRIRYSFLDMYPHIKERFKKAKVKLPYESFTAPQYMIENTIKLFDEFNNLEFESCAENTKHKLGCISQKDLNILGVKMPDLPGGFQRNGCLCLGYKKELLSNKKRCPSQCLYCYWKD